MIAENKIHISGYELRIGDLKEQLEKQRDDFLSKTKNIIIQDSTINNKEGSIINFGEIQGNVSSQQTKN
jgi:hypothetical protein